MPETGKEISKEDTYNFYGDDATKLDINAGVDKFAKPPRFPGSARAPVASREGGFPGRSPVNSSGSFPREGAARRRRRAAREASPRKRHRRRLRSL